MKSLASLLPTVAGDALQLFEATELQRIANQAEEAADILRHDLPAIITTPVEQAKIVALTARAYKVEQEMERLRKEVVAPHNATVKRVNEFFKTAFGQLLERYGKGGTAERLDDTYRRMEAQRLQRERDEALRKQTEAALAEQAALRGAAEAKTAEEYRVNMVAAEAASLEQARAEVEAPRDQSRGVKTADGKVIYHKVWKVEVEDAAQVPRQYLVVDESLLKAAVASGVREIPGCNIFETEARRRGV